MALTEVYKGENAIVLRDLVDEDGDPILISSLNYLKAQVIQYNRVIETYTLLPVPADPEISESGVNQVKIQITEEISSKFKEGAVTIKLFMKQSDSDYSVDTSLYDIDQSECFEVVL